CRSPSLQGHVSVASCVPGELIPCAFVWHDPRNYPMLQKSPRRSCRIKIRNNRIGANGFLNQRCALTPDLESILRTQTGKILLQQNRHVASLRCGAKIRTRSERTGHGESVATMWV